MPEARDALLQHYRRTREGLRTAIAGLSDGEMVDPSLDGWSIKDNLAHIALWDDLRAQEVARISAGHASVWKMSDAQDGAYNDLGYDLRRSLSLPQVLWELANSRQNLLAAIAAATPRGLDAALYGEPALVSTHEVQHAEWINSWRAGRNT